MKTRTFSIFLLTSLIMMLTCTYAMGQNKGKEKSFEIIELYVPGIHCQNCQKKIEKNIAYEKGVSDLKVDLENKIVTIKYKKDKTNIEKIQLAFEKLGYDTEIVENKIK